MTVTKLQDAMPDIYAEPTWDVALLFPAQRAWTEAEYLELTTNRLVEFSHGKIEVLPMPTLVHQLIVGYLHGLLRSFAKQKGGYRGPRPFSSSTMGW